jgi:hypothetical protein
VLAKKQRARAEDQERKIQERRDKTRAEQEALVLEMAIADVR